MSTQWKKIIFGMAALALLSVIIWIGSSRFHRLTHRPSQGDESQFASNAPSSEQKTEDSANAPHQPGSPAQSQEAHPITGAESNKAESTKQSAAPLAQGQSAPPEAACFTIAYHHEPKPGHSDEEACSHHRNLITLGHSRVNPKSVCVRVNGTPVKFQTVKGKENEILIGAIAGPKSVITARYCVGHATCQEDCTIPRDEFMDAIGGGDAADDTGAKAPSANWDSGDGSMAKMDGQVKKELAETEDAASGLSQETSIFSGWIGNAEAPAACGAKHVADRTDGGRS